jgi:transketolase
LAEKYLAFGWEVKEINGHSIEEIISALSIENKNGPRVIIANTLRGKGVSFMEGSEHWHAGKITPEQYEQAKKDIDTI